ncbi:MAG TPA: hypothetical protein VFF11_13730, partial [Candidatus Binatia bacterium]|nr:hypothetical protein [Candidatus Binatia bacterium]
MSLREAAVDVSQVSSRRYPAGSRADCPSPIFFCGAGKEWALILNRSRNAPEIRIAENAANDAR